MVGIWRWHFPLHLSRRWVWRWLTSVVVRFVQQEQRKSIVSCHPALNTKCLIVPKTLVSAGLSRQRNVCYDTAKVIKPSFHTWLLASPLTFPTRGEVGTDISEVVLCQWHDVGVWNLISWLSSHGLSTTLTLCFQDFPLTSKGTYISRQFLEDAACGSYDLIPSTIALELLIIRTRQSGLCFSA